jgi:hypothetical protein
MKEIQGDLILEKDTTFSESIKVNGSIFGKNGLRFSLTVYGDLDANDIIVWDITAKNINAEDINAWNITAWNINAEDINAWDITAKNITARDIIAQDITAWDINANDINAWNITANDITANDITANDIICESRKKKDKNNETVARIFIQNKSKLERKNWELEE